MAQARYNDSGSTLAGFKLAQQYKEMGQNEAAETMLRKARPPQIRCTCPDGMKW